MIIEHVLHDFAGRLHPSMAYNFRGALDILMSFQPIHTVVDGDEGILSLTPALMWELSDLESENLYFFNEESRIQFYRESLMRIIGAISEHASNSADELREMGKDFALDLECRESLAGASGLMYRILEYNPECWSESMNANFSTTL